MKYRSSAEVFDRAPDFPPEDEQRKSRRLTLILRAAKLITDQGQFLCVLRDISSGGIKLRLFHPVALPDHCEVELYDFEQHRLRLVWQEAEAAGFSFAEGRVDIDRMLEEAGPFAKRSIRLRLARPVDAALSLDGQTLPAHVVDLSQHGAALQCSTRLPHGKLIEVSAPELGVMDARVRWRRGDLVGVVFQRSFRLDELAKLAASLQLPLPPARRRIGARR